jgi:CDP-diacylglycerol--serine O-phosphatidyltransferase
MLVGTKRVVMEFRFLIPNSVTAANIAAGFVAIVFAARGSYEVAVYLLLLACVLDTLDGTIARRLKATSKFGQEMDSFCDAMSFGAAPALLIYFACLEPLGGWGVAISLGYLLAGILRLARFNLSADVHGKARRTVGVPVPIAASYLMATVLMRDRVGVGFAVAVTLIMSILMMSTWALPNMKGKNAVTAMLLVGIVNYFAVVFWPSWFSIGWWNVWNVAILAAAHVQDRRLAMDSQLEEGVG